MNTVTVKASKDYTVFIDSGLHQDAGKYAAALGAPGKAVIISDSNVWPLYGNIINDSLVAAGFQVYHYVFPAGERSKNGETYFYILNYLAQQQITRSDILVALGGGVVGDITGFVAATYLRGIAYMQIPTTLLAMVDSSVGGKTAIDLPAGKNLVGAFYQPSAVLCDVDALSTLPDQIFRDGCAEVIKYGILYDESLFEHLNTHKMDFDRKMVITRCIELKRNVVADDEFDRGARQKLNLGHTIGHGIEAKSNFSISHGQAVAAGLAIVSKAAYQTGICEKEVYDKIIVILQQFKLPIGTQHNEEELFDAMISDKKRTGNTIILIVPRRIGECIIHNTAVDSLKSFIKAGL